MIKNTFKIKQFPKLVNLQKINYKFPNFTNSKERNDDLKCYSSNSILTV